MCISPNMSLELIQSGGGNWPFLASKSSRLHYVLVMKFNTFRYSS
jgi:hypothetical protein